MYKLVITSEAQKEIKRLSKIYARSVKEALLDLKEDPSIGKPLRREFSGFLSYRLGVYRIIYKMSEQSKNITIITVGHRSKVYL